MSEKSTGNFFIEMISGIGWIFVGATGGFLVGYFMYGQVFGVSIPVSVFFNSDSEIANYLLEPIKQKVYICGGIGVVVIIFVTAGCSHQYN